MKTTFLLAILAICLLLDMQDNTRVDALLHKTMRRLVACCRRIKCSKEQFCYPLPVSPFGKRCICQYPWEWRKWIDTSD